MGIIEFSWQKKPEIMRVHIYKVDSFKNVPVETEEMKPQWFPVDRIPYDSMWPDDKFWMPLLLADEQFQGKFTFGEEDIILSHTLQRVNNI
jgi:8-oxo-dGTP diphosphatase/2-hydroxy-dATP diphosphatase